MKEPNRQSLLPAFFTRTDANDPKQSPVDQSKITQQTLTKHPTMSRDKFPNESSQSTDAIQPKAPSKKDAFKLMMESRHKSIGRNSPGKELENAMASSDDPQLNRVKRKQRNDKLQQLANAKNSLKRKLTDGEIDQMITEKLDNRAKRLKKLLKVRDPPKQNAKGGKSRKKTIKNSQPIEIDSDSNTSRADINEYCHVVIDEDDEEIQLDANNKNRTKEMLNFSEITPKTCDENSSLQVNSIEKISNGEDKLEVKMAKGISRPEWKMRVKLNLDEGEFSKIVARRNAIVKNPVISKENEEIVDLVGNEEGNRMVFLASEIYQWPKKELKRQDVVQVQIFPKISHVKAPYLDEELHFTNMPKTALKLSDNCTHSIQTPSIKKGDLPLNFHETTVEPINYGPPSPIPQLNTIISRYKNEHQHFPVFKTFRSLQNKRNKHANKEQQVKTKNMTTAQLWTDLYRPSKAEEMLGNGRTRTKLTKWLEAWIEFSNEMHLKRKRRTRNDSNSSSSSDFLTDSESCDAQMPRSAMILYGANGAGKTSAVYALCEAIGINVLELNASSKRTGKRLFQELQEATKSHHVNKDNSLTQFLSAPKSVEKPKTLTLLLVEDADVVFEQDDNFLGALSQLLTTTKRPVILTTNNPTALILRKFFDQHASLPFHPMRARILAPWLQIVCTLEGVNVSPDNLHELIRLHRGDVRKTLLELQFFVMSGGGAVDAERIAGADDVVMEADACAVQNEGHVSSHRFDLKTSNIEAVWRQLDLHEQSLKHAANVFDSFSLCDTFWREIAPNHPRNWKRTPQDSLEVKESFADYSGDFMEDLTEFLIPKRIPVKKTTMANYSEEWLQKQHKADEVLLAATNCINLDRRGLYCDYLPTLRTIAMAERTRCKENTKRRNRFYHYLRGLGVDDSDSVLSGVYTVFKDT